MNSLERKKQIRMSMIENKLKEGLIVKSNLKEGLRIKDKIMAEYKQQERKRNYDINTKLQNISHTKAQRELQQ